MEMRDKPMSEWTLGEVKEECAGRTREGRNCEGCPARVICEAPPNMWRFEKPSLTEPEMAICRALGARWASRDTGDHTAAMVVVWATKPERVGPIWDDGHEVLLATVKAELFPSLRPGDLVKVPEEKEAHG